jgi:pimeloyl-ACP methyl ester carboxylesterase
MASVSDGMRPARMLFHFACYITILPFCSSRQVPAELKASSPPQLWGDLQAGPFAVGFRTVFRYDNSRTWKLTRGNDGSFSPDLSGRPIQINIWYPATMDNSAQRMRFADYVDQSSAETFENLNSVMKQRNRGDAAGSIPRAELPSLQSAELNACRDAPLVRRRFPAVLYFGGLNAAINGNAILAEYLASHGYMVAAISLIGPSNEQTFQSRTAADLEASVRDMEFAWSVLQDQPDVDRTRLAVVGHSVGAVEAVILGLRNANVSALIALDGTYGFEGLSTVLTRSYGYEPERMRAAFLDLRRAPGAQGNAPLDLSAVQSFRHADRTLVTIDKMHHSDFTSFAMVGALFHAPLPTGYPLNGWSRQTGRAGYQQVCRIVLSFLDAKVKSDSQAAVELNRVHEVAGISLRHEAAVPPAPSPLEAAAMASARGLEATKNAFIVSCGDSALASCIDAERFNTWGYNLLNRQRPKDALTVFQLNVWAHPQSANAQDSLADAYLSAGDKESAKTAIERALALAPADSSFDPTERASFLTEEEVKLQQFK